MHEIAKEEDDPFLFGISLSNLAKMSYHQGNFQEAADMYQQIGKIRQHTGNIQGEANKRGNLANCYASMHRFDEAISLYEEDRKVALETGDAATVLTSDKNLAKCFRALGQYDKAIGIHRLLWNRAEDLHEEDEMMYSAEELGQMLWIQVRVEQGVATATHPTSIAAATLALAARGEGGGRSEGPGANESLTISKHSAALSEIDKRRLVGCRDSAADWFKMARVLAVVRNPDRISSECVRLARPHHHIDSNAQLHLSFIAFYSGVDIDESNALELLQRYLKKITKFAHSHCARCFKSRAEFANSIGAVHIEVAPLLKCSGCGVVRSFFACLPDCAALIADV